MLVRGAHARAALGMAGVLPLCHRLPFQAALYKPSERLPVGLADSLDLKLVVVATHSACTVIVLHSEVHKSAALPAVRGATTALLVRTGSCRNPLGDGSLPEGGPRRH